MTQVCSLVLQLSYGNLPLEVVGESKTLVGIGKDCKVRVSVDKSKVDVVIEFLDVHGYSLALVPVALINPLHIALNFFTMVAEEPSKQGKNGRGVL